MYILNISKHTHIYIQRLLSSFIITVYNDVFACLCEHMYIYPRRMEDSPGSWMRIVIHLILTLGTKNCACC